MQHLGGAAAFTVRNESHKVNLHDTAVAAVPSVGVATFRFLSTFTHLLKFPRPQTAEINSYCTFCRFMCTEQLRRCYDFDFIGLAITTMKTL